jgi:hypothetical protein
MFHEIKELCKFVTFSARDMEQSRNIIDDLIGETTLDIKQFI